MNRQPIHVIHIRLIGSHDDVAFWLAVFDRLAVLTDVSDPEPARSDRVRVYATIRRRTPPMGGRTT